MQVQIQLSSRENYKGCSEGGIMTSVLSLPDELIKLVGSSFSRAMALNGVKYWCRFASNCTHFGKMQFPNSRSKWFLDLYCCVEGDLQMVITML